MAKEPETVDRFRITAEVEPAKLGPMLATFAKMGLQKRKKWSNQYGSSFDET